MVAERLPRRPEQKLVSPQAPVAPMERSSSPVARDTRSLRQQLEEDEIVELDQNENVQDFGGGITNFLNSEIVQQDTKLGFSFTQTRNCWKAKHFLYRLTRI